MAEPLTDAQLRALTAICDTLVPTLDPPPDSGEAERAFWQRAASDLGVPAEVVQTIQTYMPVERQAQTWQLLALLSRPLTAGLLTGRFRAFADLPLEVREQVLRRWSVSPIGRLRQAFQGLRRLTHGLFYSVLDADGANPNWAALGYPGPVAPATPRLPSIPTLRIESPSELACDVVVVGSGAGGGVVAGELAQAGKQVIVLEKGGYSDEATYSTLEVEAFEQLYEQAGTLTTEDLGVLVLAGSTLGGGTTVNWSTSFRTPEYVLREWATEHHLVGYLDSAFQASLDAVCLRINVNTDESQPNGPNAALARGCAALGYHAGPNPRNVAGCRDCGWCCFGCIHGAKQSTLRTYLQDAVAHGAQVIVNCFVERVLVENGRAAGVQGRIRNGAGQELPITVRAPLVVVAAGAIHSPAILLRSGIDNPNIGLNLRLHPTTAARGEYPAKVEMWRGVMQAVHSDQFVDLDGQHYGIKLEVPCAHPGLQATAFSWLSGRQHKGDMLRAAYQAAFIVLTRDRGSGRVTLDAQGRPRLHYRLDRVDGRHMLAGLQEGLRLHVAAGAQVVGTLHSGLAPYRVADGSQAAFEAYLERVARSGTRVNELMLFSAHQMGTCRMGGERARSVLDHNCESWDVRNLFVADASTFPTPSGVNPMITIMAIAHKAAQYLKMRP